MDRVMGYGIKFEAADGRECILCRSRHTGDWILQEKNQYYGYYATVLSFGERLGLIELDKVANKLALDAHDVYRAVEEQVREGKPNGMLPLPGFRLTEGVTI